MTAGIYAMQSQRVGGGSSQPQGEEGEICFYNIGPRQRRMRMIFGLVTLVIGFAIGATLVVLDAATGWRLALALVFITAGIGIFQAREKT